ncbi:unnamed protein product, partial [Didymodactylos carnosus]
MLTRQGVLKLNQEEFVRLTNIEFEHTDHLAQDLNHSVHRPVCQLPSCIMAKKTVTTIISKAVEQIPKFCGTTDDNAIEWLKHLTTALHMAEISDSQASKIIITFLDAAAKDWFIANKETFTSWSLFVKEFQNTYSSPAAQQFASQCLPNRQQRSPESVIGYYTDILKLCTIVDPNMADASKCDHLFHGLKSSLMKEVFRRAPTTPEEFLKVAKQEEVLEQL